MEEMIKNYEKYIAAEVGRVKKSSSKAGKEGLFKLHTETVRNFQHERLVHLMIMLFFVMISIVCIFIYCRALITGVMGESPAGFVWSFSILTLLLTGLTVAYVKHYYFLENHVQGLYKYFKEIEEIE